MRSKYETIQLNKDLRELIDTTYINKMPFYSESLYQKNRKMSFHVDLLTFSNFVVKN